MPQSTSSSGTFEVRRASKDDWKTVVEWEVNEGWNPGRTDLESFYAADNDGFFIGYLNQEPVSCISVVRHGSDYAFVGLYIVKPPFRGMGFGLKTWKYALSFVSGSANIGLDAVLEREGHYAKEGFKTVHRHVRYKGDNVLLPSDDALDHTYITDACMIPFDQLLDYDRTVFPGDRPAFLKTFISRPGTIALAYVQEGKLRGFGAIRPAIEGWKVAPLFADDEIIADIIFGSLAKKADAEGGQHDRHGTNVVFIDVPDVNDRAVKLASKRGMVSCFECARMYTKGKPKGLMEDRIYGVASLELG